MSQGLKPNHAGAILTGAMMCPFWIATKASFLRLSLLNLRSLAPISFLDILRLRQATTDELVELDHSLDPPRAVHL